MLHLDDSTTTIQRIPDLPCSVLLVDDDEILREQLAAIITAAGYEVRTAGSGEEALREFDLEPARIVISDWEMPDMDGIALCRNIRSRKTAGYTFVLLFTVRRNKRDLIAGMGAGADDYIVKGCSTEELLARLNVGRRITGLEHSLRVSNQENRKLAFSDALTGVYNRRYLLKHLPREFERSRRYGRPLSVLVCDLDRFKLINDGFGHEAGDLVLQEFCRRSMDQLRSADWLTRAGGEEFVIILPETNLDGAAAVAEKLRAAMAAHDVEIGTDKLRVTVSVGYASAVMPEHFEELSFDDLLRTADSKLYEAKLTGRNRTLGCYITRTKGEAFTSRRRLTGRIGQASKLTLVES